MMKRSKNFMHYNNGKTPALGDKVIYKPATGEMVAGTVVFLSGTSNYLRIAPALTERPLYSYGTEPNPLLYAPQCLLQSDVPFSPVPTPLNSQLPTLK